MTMCEAAMAMSDNLRPIKPQTDLPSQLRVGQQFQGYYFIHDLSEPQKPTLRDAIALSAFFVLLVVLMCLTQP